MKHPKRLTLKEKILLEGLGHNPKNFLRIKKTTEKYEFDERTVQVSRELDKLIVKEMGKNAITI